MQLLRALRTVSRIESSEIRENVFLDIAGRQPVIRLVLFVYGIAKSLGISHLMVAGYGLSYFVRAQLPRHKVRWLGIAVYPNEVKQLDDLDRVMGEGWQVSRVVWQLFSLRAIFLLWGAVLRVRRMRRVLRLVRRIDATHRFMPACRVTAALFLYLRLKPWLAQQRPRAVVVTSDYSPDGAALAAAAGSLGIMRIYMPHALPSFHLPGRGLLTYELYVFDSEAMHSRFATMGATGGEVVYRGVRGQHKALQLERLREVEPCIGIFLSGFTNMAVLESTIRGLVRFEPRRILVRGHPVDFSNPDFSKLADINPLVTISRGATLEGDAEACDVILAGNTTAILETLRMGVPTVYYGKLDMITHDYNGFVADRLAPEIADVTALDLRMVEEFFSSGWVERMHYYDAAYGRDAEDLQRQVRGAIRGALGDGA